MSDSPDTPDSPATPDLPDTPDTPDFLDRLIARHTPAARPDVVRVRPRLPGPFERVEAVRDRTDASDEDALLWPAAPPAAVPPAPPGVAPARIRTERERTVVQTEREPGDPAPRPAPPARPDVPLLRPAAQLPPGPRPAADTARRAAGRGRADRDPAPTAASAPTPPGAGAAPPAAVPAATRPSAADTTAARDAVRQAAARRGGRAPEQVVQVQIGRLEVTAAPAGGGTQQRPGAARRPTAAVSLADYLARGRE
ncbi:hypothetical protein ACYF6T_35760 [Streptomyces sp. 7R007]